MSQSLVTCQLCGRRDFRGMGLVRVGVWLCRSRRQCEARQAAQRRAKGIWDGIERRKAVSA